MLTIQPKVLNNYRPAFKSNENDSERAVNLAEMDENTYRSNKSDLEDSIKEFERMANENTPKPVKKFFKVLTFLTTCLLAGMAGGWGAKKSIEGAQALTKKAPVVSFKNNLKSGFKTVKATSAKVLKKFAESKFASKIKTKYAEFGETKFGKPIVKFFNKTGEFFKNAYNKTAKVLEPVINKIKGVKKEKAENIAVNSIGVSSGVASGVSSIQEKSEVEE